MKKILISVLAIIVLALPLFQFFEGNTSSYCEEIRYGDNFLKEILGVKISHQDCHPNMESLFMGNEIITPQWMRKIGLPEKAPGLFSPYKEAPKTNFGNRLLIWLLRTFIKMIPILLLLLLRVLFQTKKKKPC